MPQDCPLGFGADVSCRLDCSTWHRGFGFCTAKYNTWQEADEAMGKVVSAPLPRDSYQQVKAELNHLSNKLNEHIDASKKRLKGKSALRYY